MMKIKRYKDIDKELGSILQIKYDDELETFIFDIFDDSIIETPSVELNKRKIKSMIKFLERCLRK